MAFDRKAYNKEYYQSNHEKIRKQQTEYYKKNPERNILRDAIQWCHNPNNKSYEDYGLEGIKVCARWRCDNGLENFIANIGKRPAKGYQLDRIDGDYGYTPWNCRWVTARENVLNRSTTHWITFQGKTMCLTDWAKEVGLRRGTLKTRITQLGWTEQEAVSIPNGMTRKQYYKQLEN